MRIEHRGVAEQNKRQRRHSIARVPIHGARHSCNCFQHVRQIGTNCPPPAAHLKPGYHPMRFSKLIGGTHLVQTIGGPHLVQTTGGDTWSKQLVVPTCSNSKQLVARTWSKQLVAQWHTLDPNNLLHALGPKNWWCTLGLNKRWCAPDPIPNNWLRKLGANNLWGTLGPNLLHMLDTVNNSFQEEKILVHNIKLFRFEAPSLQGRHVNKYLVTTLARDASTYWVDVTDNRQASKYWSILPYNEKGRFFLLVCDIWPLT